MFIHSCIICWGADGKLEVEEVTLIEDGKYAEGKIELVKHF